jgi:hypothetical protein
MSVLGTLKKINHRLGNPGRFLRGMQEAIEPRLRMMKFERDRKLREQRYAGAGLPYESRRAIVEQIERDGFARIPQAVDVNLLLEIRRQGEAHLDAGTSLQPVSKDSARAAGDLKAPKVHLAADELTRGQDYFRQHTNYVSIADPMVSCPSVLAAAFHPLLLDVAWTYLRCVPAIGGMNLRKSYANALPEFDTLFFHIDPNSPKFLKFFFYLNDVDMNGGPFCYVRGTHRQRHQGWRRKGRWTIEEMEAHYGKESVVYLTASLGDVLVADTNGFHRGTKLVSNDRWMLTVDFVVHEEFEGTQDAEMFRLPRSAYDRLQPREKAAADFLAVV